MVVGSVYPGPGGAIAVRNLRSCAVQWWVWLIIVVIVIVAVIGGVLAIQARRRTGGVIISDRDKGDGAR